MPSLLDRLVENSSSLQSTDEAPVDLFVSPQRYLETVRRDLYWLLRTEVGRPGSIRLEDRARPEPKRGSASEPSDTNGEVYLADYPQVCASAIAFGIPTQSGGQGLRTSAAELVRAVERAIRIFEPRIDSRTLRVRLTPVADGASENESVSSFGFEIEGDIRMKPVPEHLLLKAYYSPAFAQWRIEGTAYGS